MEGIWLDLKQAGRQFARRPGMSTLVVVTLALGIGAATTMFSLLVGVVLRPLDFESPEELLFITESSPDGSQVYSVSIPNFRDWRDHNRTFRSLAAFRAQSFNLRLGGGGDTIRARGGMVTSDFFETLGARFATGSGFGSADAVVLSAGFANEHFAAPERAVGKTLFLNERPFFVAAVTPPDFEFLTRNLDFWVPIESFRNELPWNDRGDHPALWVVGRLRPDATLTAARDDMARLSREIDRVHDHPHPAVVSTLHDRSVRRARPALAALGGSVLLLLVIACVNVANLLLVQAGGRGREMATRTALGAGTGRLFRQLVVEAVALSTAGGLLGVLSASWGVDLVRSLMPATTPRLSSVSLGLEGLLFATGMSVLTGVLFGLAPLVDVLRRGRGATSSLPAARALVGERRRLARGLVVAEVALSVVLLLVTGLLVKSFLRLSDVEPGFQADSRLAARITLPAREFQEPARAAAFYRQVLEALEGAPGVTAAAVSTGLPLVNPGVEAGVKPASGEEDDEILASVQIVSGDYFTTMGVRLLKGRVLDARDDATAPAVAVVDETLERALFPGRSALGEKVSVGGTVDEPRLAEIVGVVEHVLNYQLTERQYPEIYLPLGQPPGFSAGIREGNLIVRYDSPGAESAAVASLRDAVRRVDESQPIYSVMTLPEIVALAQSPARTNGVLSAAFSAAALLLSGVGLYGVLSGVVSRRTREIGLRMALGATPRRILGSVLGEGLGLALVGAGLGLLAAVGLGQTLSSLLFEASSLDLDVIVVTSMLVGSVVAVACGLPAKRASSIEVTAALVEE